MPHCPVNVNSYMPKVLKYVGEREKMKFGPVVLPVAIKVLSDNLYNCHEIGEEAGQFVPIQVKVPSIIGLKAPIQSFSIVSPHLKVVFDQSNIGRKFKLEKLPHWQVSHTTFTLKLQVGAFPHKLDAFIVTVVVPAGKKEFGR